MINKNQIYDIVSKAIRLEHGTQIFVVSEAVNAPATLPCVWVVETSAVPEKRYIRLDLKDIQHRSIYTVQAFSDLQTGAAKQAKDLIDTAEKTFRKMGYICTYNSPVENTDDTIKRHVARFTRYIADNDILPTINLEDF